MVAVSKRKEAQRSAAMESTESCSHMNLIYSVVHCTGCNMFWQCGVQSKYFIAASVAVLYHMLEEDTGFPGVTTVYASEFRMASRAFALHAKYFAYKRRCSLQQGMLNSIM